MTQKEADVPLLVRHLRTDWATLEKKRLTHADQIVKEAKGVFQNITAAILEEEFRCAIPKGYSAVQVYKNRDLYGLSKGHLLEMAYALDRRLEELGLAGYMRVNTQPLHRWSVTLSPNQWPRSEKPPHLVAVYPPES